MYYKHRLFMKIVFNAFLNRFVSFFESLGDCFSGFLGLENTLENEGIFNDVTDPEQWIW